MVVLQQIIFWILFKDIWYSSKNKKFIISITTDFIKKEAFWLWVPLNIDSYL